MTPDDDGAEGPKVFLSYAHDDDNHVAAVHDLSRLLVASGIAVELDLWRTDSRQDWYAWALREIQAADFVIVVASPKYRDFGDGNADSDEHRGVQAEAAAMRELLYRDRKTWLRRILPAILPGRSLDDLPEFVQPVSASHFIVDTITGEGADGLLRVLTGQPRHVRPRRGKIPVLPPKRRFPPAVSKFRWPTLNTRRASALAAMLLLTASVFALPAGKALPLELNADNAREAPHDAGARVAGSTTTTGPSHEQPSAGTAVPGPTASPGAGDQSRRAPAPEGTEWDAPAMPEGVPTDGMPSHQGVLDVVAVGHSFAVGIDRITVTVRNTHPDDVLVRQIDIFMDDWVGHEWADPDWWHFVVSKDMEAGAPAYDGSSRVHGTVRMSGTEFRLPLVGRGYMYYDLRSWRRLLTFAPQKLIAGSETVTIVIDVPLTHLLQRTSPNQPAGPVTEQTLDPQHGSVFTRVDIWTPDDHSFACDYLRRPEDKPVCDQVDPAAAVELPG